MSNSSVRARRTAKAIRVPAMLARYVPAMQTAGGPAARPGAREPLLTRTWRGITLNRYVDSCELVYADGRKVSARGRFGLLAKALFGGAK